MVKNILAIIVTYNRLELLKECLFSLKSQVLKPNKILVINNSSDDGTLEWLKSQENIEVITQKNSGSSGGQYRGMKFAIEENYDWIWCLDDDTICFFDTLQRLVEVANKNEELAYYSSLVYWNEKILHNANVPIIKKDTSKLGVPVISNTTFVSFLFPTEFIKQLGYPYKEFFVWFDDWEFTDRLYRNGKRGYLIYDSKVIHKTKDNSAYNLNQKSETRKFNYYYGVRNDFFLRRIRSKNLYQKFKFYFIFIKYFIKFSIKGYPVEYKRGLLSSLHFNPKIEY